MPYKDIAVIRNRDDAHEVHDEETGAMYLTYDNDQWVSYDTPETLKAKVDYANSIGYVILSLRADVFSGGIEGHPCHRIVITVRLQSSRPFHLGH